mmetsp:Transcript_27200/g.55677  ORF Transcript_27200/g.55677 Transcript_27200/m.55677 type:complete len:279 (-) Transcript_27200:163-999(-)
MDCAAKHPTASPGGHSARHHCLSTTDRNSPTDPVAPAVGTALLLLLLLPFLPFFEGVDEGEGDDGKSSSSPSCSHKALCILSDSTPLVWGRSRLATDDATVGVAASASSEEDDGGAERATPWPTGGGRRAWEGRESWPGGSTKGTSTLVPPLPLLLPLLLLLLLLFISSMAAVRGHCAAKGTFFTTKPSASKRKSTRPLPGRAFTTVAACHPLARHPRSNSVGEEEGEDGLRALTTSPTSTPCCHSQPFTVPPPPPTPLFAFHACFHCRTFPCARRAA